MVLLDVYDVRCPLDSISNRPRLKWPPTHSAVALKVFWSAYHNREDWLMVVVLVVVDEKKLSV